jgi:hypothetical protein
MCDIAIDCGLGDELIVSPDLQGLVDGLKGQGLGNQEILAVLAKQSRAKSTTDVAWLHTDSAGRNAPMPSYADLCLP